MLRLAKTQHKSSPPAAGRSCAPLPARSLSLSLPNLGSPAARAGHKSCNCSLLCVARKWPLGRLASRWPCGLHVHYCAKLQPRPQLFLLFFSVAPKGWPSYYAALISRRQTTGQLSWPAGRRLSWAAICNLEFASERTKRRALGELQAASERAEGLRNERRQERGKRRSRSRKRSETATCWLLTFSPPKDFALLLQGSDSQ